MNLYLTPVEALVLDRVLVDRFGGETVLRDAGVLEAALFRPQSGHYKDLIHEAAALFESLAMSRPFVAGNERIAFACTDIFLRINGYRLQPKPMSIYRWMMGHLEKNTFQIVVIEPWLRKNVRLIA